MTSTELRRADADVPSSWRNRLLPELIDLDSRNSGGTVAIVGLGYVGLPTALSLLDHGSRVIGLDVSTRRLDAIWAGDVDLSNADLARLLTHRGSPSWELTDDEQRLRLADTVVVCVPTPVTQRLVPDLHALQSACGVVVRHARRGQTVVLTSTTYVGCTRDLLIEPLTARGLRPGQDVFVAFSPERINPGADQHSPETTPRVIGGLTQQCTDRAAQALRRTCRQVHPVSSPEAAELTKLLENTFRAVNIALANEIADIAGHLGLSAREVLDAAATKPYGFMAFQPGPGVGGHCIPCDPHYLLWQLRGQRVAAPLIDAAMTGIALRPGRVVSRLGELLATTGQALNGAQVHIVGVAYKPGVADIRESPALEIIASCLSLGASVSYTDDLVPSLTVSGHRLHHTPSGRVQADVVLVHTSHPQTDLSWIRDHPVVLDATYRLDDVPQATVP